LRNIIQLSGHQRMVEGKHGLFVYNHHDFYLGQALELYGECCELELELFKQILNPTDTVIEVGANIGIHSVPLGKYLEGGTIHLFEPQPVIFQNLCANLSINCLENAIAQPFAVGDKVGSIVVPHVDYGKSGNFGGISLSESGSGTHVQLITLDAYANDLDVALIKADVEGMELNVLQGAEQTIARCRPFLYVENDRVEKSKQLIEKCWVLGYRMYWHVARLYNKNNWYGNKDNIYGNIAAYNMFCVPKERDVLVADGVEVVDSARHPLIP
jgi:FkbM family methyltransferase